MKMFKRVLAAVCTLAVTATMSSPLAAVSGFANAETVQQENAITPLADKELPMEGTCGKNLTWVLDDEGMLTISGTGAMSNYSDNSPWFGRDDIKIVLIKDDVTSIGGGAFGCCRNLTTVTIPDSITSIGRGAFYGCSLTTVTIPDSVTSIGKGAFKASSLTTVTIPDSVTSIGENAFESCRNLTTVMIGNGVTSIGWYAFYDCTSLTTVTIPDSVTSIGWYAFRDCTSLITVTIPDSVTSIDGGVFHGCTSLTTMTIPDSVTSIGHMAFFCCTSLMAIDVDERNANYCSKNGVLFNKDKTELIQYPIGKTNKSYTVPDSVTIIEDGGFAGCTSLTTVTIPNSVTSIDGYVFYGCTGLTTVTIPGSVTIIEAGVFAGCTNLTTVTIQGSITSIGFRAFSDCTNLKNIYYSGTKEEWTKIPIASLNENLTNATIHYNSTGSDDTEDILVSFRGVNMNIVWNDGLFSHSTYEYDNNLAIAALTLSGAAESETQDEVQTVLKQMGFGSIVCNKYGESNPMQPAYAFATKTITVNGKEKTLVCVTVRGSKSAEDWFITDFIDGAGVGFTNSALYLADELDRYLVENAGYTQNRKEDFVFLITGHSLGGAVAAYLMELCITHDIVPQENVFAYTFAAPRYFTNIFKQYKNLFEIINKWDMVPNIGYAGSPFGTGHDGVFVEFTPYEHIDFESYLNRWFPDFKLLSIDKQHNHASETYMAQLLANPPSVGLKKFLGKSYFISVCCPVNVELYDSDDTLIAKVTDNKIDESVTSDSVFCKIEGDEKYFFVESDKEIYVKFTGTDSGTMEYSVQKLTAADEVATEDDFITYETVVLEEGKTFYSEIKEKDDTANVSLYVVDPETNQPIKTVEPDGTETDLKQENTFTITFDANGGTVSDSVMITGKNGKLNNLPTPTRDNYTFDGWFTAIENGKKVTVDTVFIEDTTVYAHWTEIPPESTDIIIKVTIPKPTENAPSTGNIKADIKQNGETIKTLNIDSDGKTSLDNLADGKYTFTFYADNCAPREYNVSVSNGEVSGLEDGVELHLYGDIDGDGKVNMKDVGRANAHAKNTAKISGYDLSVSDINGDGKINMQDVGLMNAHAKNTKSLW